LPSVALEAISYSCTALARRLAETKVAVRLTIVSRGNPIEAAQAFRGALSLLNVSDTAEGRS
jgi:hypothetical protein